VAHPDKSTTFIVLPTRVFQLNYSCLLTLFTIRLVYAKQVQIYNRTNILICQACLEKGEAQPLAHAMDLLYSYRRVDFIGIPINV
jgi:hypothetical protein